MHLSDATTGQRVLVYYSPKSKAIVVGPGFGSDVITIPTTVLVEYDHTGVVLGWKIDEVRPETFLAMCNVPISMDWLIQGFVQAHKYGSYCECLSMDQVAATSPKEKPCKQCGRNNDVGVSKCWLCEAANPTT